MAMEFMRHADCSQALSRYGDHEDHEDLYRLIRSRHQAASRPVHESKHTLGAGFIKNVPAATQYH